MKLSDGLSVLYVTATGYFCAYCFQLGIFYHYNIPTELINITIQSMSSFCFFLISVLSIFIGPLLDTPITIEFKNLKPITRLAIVYLGMFLFLTLSAFLFIPDLKLYHFIVLFFTSLPVIGRDFILPILFRNDLSIIESINKEFHDNRTKPRLTFLTADQQYYFVLMHRCVALSILSLVIGGLYTVIHKNNTLCNQQQVLATSGDSVIIKDKNNFKIISNSQCEFSKKE
ncbi:hypothetical protein [Pantoea sp. ME81]|uniref:hypothetical protein n=1 Tax=Pantoea sp. ME81 TaxID=2743935 RepID=UPI0015F4E919|nr:hypothetical protein [Pantoea sp. ME81]